MMLPHKDSNLEWRYQKPMCYHYTMGQLQYLNEQAKKEVTPQGLEP